MQVEQGSKNTDFFFFCLLRPEPTASGSYGLRSRRMHDLSLSTVLPAFLSYDLRIYRMYSSVRVLCSFIEIRMLI